MQTPLLESRRLRDYTNIPFEIFIAVFSIFPFFVLAYFYTALPGRVPLFMSLNGEVAVWGEKNVLSVFRVPLMALDTQIVCLLMKYSLVRSETILPPEATVGKVEYQKHYVRLGTAIWDWLRCLVAFKMSASSLNTIFLSLEEFKIFSRPAFLITAIAALLSIAGGLIYGHRLLALKRKYGEKLGDAKIEKVIDSQYVYGNLLYFNPSDPALFVRKYLFNFANKWAWLFIACVAAYPMLVFSPI